MNAKEKCQSCGMPLQDTQTGSVELAIEKARTAALFRRPTKVFQDGVAGGGEGLRLLRLTGAIPIDGGVPIIEASKVVGAIGVSGAVANRTALLRRRVPAPLNSRHHGWRSQSSAEAAHPDRGSSPGAWAIHYSFS
jgi:hypothetical protein